MRAFYETDMRNNQMQATRPARTEGQLRCCPWSSSGCCPGPPPVPVPGLRPASLAGHGAEYFAFAFVKIKKFFKKQRDRRASLGANYAQYVCLCVCWCIGVLVCVCPALSAVPAAFVLVVVVGVNKGSKAH